MRIIRWEVDLVEDYHLRPQDRSFAQSVLASVFSDESALFRTPAEPEPGDRIQLRLRLMRGLNVWVTLLTGWPTQSAPMRKVRTDEFFDWYEAELVCWDRRIYYSFLIEWEGRYIHCRKTGSLLTDSVPVQDPARSFVIQPGFHVPDWSKGAVQYQIFPDRFRNGDPTNDVLPRECAYAKAQVSKAASWDALPGEGDFRCFYGGDLQGVLDKLDYLQSLGVEVLYLNPIFVSPSCHGYDTQDYRHVDPHLTRIVRDGGAVLAEGDLDNLHAERYTLRTTDPDNLAASNEFFAEFCRQVHERGMRVILDGVFNHCGSFHRWMDREGFYRREQSGAFTNDRSPYRDYFNFSPGGKYESWWGFETLPKLNYEASRELCEEIFRIGVQWVSPPYNVDGWRLDVAADLGHSREFNHVFWREFRRRVKEARPDALIIAEHYGDPSQWLHGDEWDSVMNYDAFMEPVAFFLTGMEKHSDHYSPELDRSGPAFFRMLSEAAARLPLQSLHCAMNELSNHDHSRFLTRTNRTVGRLRSKGAAAAAEGIDKGAFCSAVVLQMTLPGAPTIYYGDEAGQVGWTDPDNRRTYPWGREDENLIALHRALTALRKRLPVLRGGSLKPLYAAYGAVAYARFDAKECVLVLCSNADEGQTFSLPMRDIGIPDGAKLRRVFETRGERFDADERSVPPVADGMLTLSPAAQGTMILHCKFKEI